MLSADRNQQKAIQHGRGPALVIAGPGSGKTYVLTHHIVYLIQKMHVLPESILVITFTKAAAINMQNRFKKIFDSSGLVHFGTFHSIFYQFLKYYSPNRVPIIADEKKRYEFLRVAIANTSFPNDLETLENLLLKISVRKNGLTEDTPRDMDYELKKEFNQVFDEYNHLLFDHSFIDYDDIILLFYDFLKSHISIRKEITNTIQYILVDEFQDINEQQYKVLKLLTGDGHNLFVVGDDDQAIYSFRGANPLIMNRFLKDYPDAITYPLVANYRSRRRIVLAASKVIGENSERLKKTNESVTTEEGTVQFRYFKNYEEQRQFIFQKVRANISNHIRTVVLLRTNQDATRYCKFFNENGLNDIHNSGKEEGIRNQVLTDLMSYLKLADSGEREWMFQIMNRPERYLRRSMFPTHVIYWDEIIRREAGRLSAGALQKLQRDLKYLKNASPFCAIHYIRKVVGYDGYLKKEMTPERFHVAVAVLESIQETAKQLSKLELLKDRIRQEMDGAFEENKKDQRQSKKTFSTINPYLEVMTLHAAKGLEFDCVILPDVNDEKIPGRTVFLPEAVEEERRLLYVGMTRAINELVITAIKNEETQFSVPSRFIRCLESDYPCNQ